MKRRANGEGSLYLRKDGRWCGRYYVTFPDGARKRQQVFGPTREVAARKLYDAIARANNYVPIYRDEHLTLTRIGEYWLTEVIPKEFQPCTVLRARRLMRKYVFPCLGWRQLGDLRVVAEECGEIGGGAEVSAGE